MRLYGTVLLAVRFLPAVLFGILCFPIDAVAANRVSRYGIRVIITGYSTPTNLTAFHTPPGNLGGAETSQALGSAGNITANGAYTYYPVTNGANFLGGEFSVRVGRISANATAKQYTTAYTVVGDEIAKLLPFEGGALEFNYDLGGTNAQPQTTTNCNWTGCVQNQGSSIMAAVWRINGSVVHTEWVSTGATACYTIQYTCGSPQDMDCGYMATESDFIPVEGGGVQVTNITTTNVTTSFTATNNWGSNYTAQQFFPTNGTQTSWSNIVNGGPINFNGTAATTMKDDTAKAGFNALVAGQNDAKGRDAQALTYLSLIAENTRTNTGGGGSTTISNLNFTGQTNAITSNEMAKAAMDLDALAFTNQASRTWGYVAALTNQSIGLVGMAGLAFTNLVGGGLVLPTEPVSGQEYYEEIAQLDPSDPATIFKIDTANIPNHAVFAIVRAAIAWVIYLLTLRLMLEHTEDQMQKLQNQRQVQGSSQEIFGTNVSIIVGGIYVPIICAIIASVPVFLAATYASLSGNVSANITSFNTMVGVPEAAFAWYIFPLWTAITATFTYLVWRFLLFWPFMIIVRAIIMALVA